MSSSSASSGPTETVLHSFGAPSSGDGNSPRANLVQATDGNFYGTTANGGVNDSGTVFKITPAGVETVLHSFGTVASVDGRGPFARLVQATDGNFYGTTANGGDNATGTVFKITPAGVETVLHSFGTVASGDGRTPLAGLIQATDGNFYGTTRDGGANTHGIVFKISPTGVETILHSFGASGDSTAPQGDALIQATDGNLYGVTPTGGANGGGAIFKVTLAGVESVFYSFPAVTTFGYAPAGALIQATDGNFYGTAGLGGANDGGAAFKISPSGTYNVLYSFGAASSGDAFQPRGLIQSTDGNFYGATRTGGPNNQGAVFKITPAGVETVLQSFLPRAGGYTPVGLIQGTDGAFYGTTEGGGDNGTGVVFKISF